MACKSEQFRRHWHISRYKLDRKLFRWYTRNAEEVMASECQFADDATLLATTERGAELITTEYMLVAKDFGLTLSIPEMKVMAVGRAVIGEELCVGEEEIESVNEFPYLWSPIESSGRVILDVERRIAQASKAFGELRKSVLLDCDLKVITKRNVYQACVLSVLLYGSEYLSPLKKDLKKLDSV